MYQFLVFCEKTAGCLASCFFLSYVSSLVIFLSGSVTVSFSIDLRNVGCWRMYVTTCALFVVVAATAYHNHNLIDVFSIYFFLFLLLSRRV